MKINWHLTNLVRLSIYGAEQWQDILANEQNGTEQIWN